MVLLLRGMAPLVTKAGAVLPTTLGSARLHVKYKVVNLYSETFHRTEDWLKHSRTA